MPRIAQVGAATLYVYFNDHNPPHFHAIENDDEMIVAINNLSVMKGTVLSSRAILHWAEENHAILIAAWDAANPENPCVQ